VTFPTVTIVACGTVGAVLGAIVALRRHPAYAMASAFLLLAVVALLATYLPPAVVTAAAWEDGIGAVFTGQRLDQLRAIASVTVAAYALAAGVVALVRAPLGPVDGVTPTPAPRADATARPGVG
jgi:formate hydrogenlyase subunit 3/multisubunit Na+/H+ antiporter MnhD subunit